MTRRRRSAQNPARDREPDRRSDEHRRDAAEHATTARPRRSRRFARRPLSSRWARVSTGRAVPFAWRISWLAICAWRSTPNISPGRGEAQSAGTSKRSLASLTVLPIRTRRDPRSSSPSAAVQHLRHAQAAIGARAGREGEQELIAAVVDRALRACVQAAGLRAQPRTYSVAPSRRRSPCQAGSTPSATSRRPASCRAREGRVPPGR